MVVGSNARRVRPLVCSILGNHRQRRRQRWRFGSHVVWWWPLLAAGKFDGLVPKVTRRSSFSSGRVLAPKVKQEIT